MKNKGFSLIEIIIALAILAIVFVFSFYFISSINLNKNLSEEPYLLKGYNYGDKFCTFKNDISNIKINKTILLTKYIPMHTPITSINIFDKNKLIVTTNSATTSDADIFIFKIDNSTTTPYYELLSKYDTGPGINDSILVNGILYTANTSVNSHIQIFNISGSTLSMIYDVRIDELLSSYSIPKKIYIDKDNLFIGTEKNNYGGELFVFQLLNRLPSKLIKAIEIGGQVNSLYSDSGYLYIANASDIELLILDNNFDLINSYDAPLSAGNGKSVFYLFPNIFLGRTISSFEFNILSFKNNVINFINKYKTNGIDFIQPIDSFILLSTSLHKYLQFYDHNFIRKKEIDLPDRVNAYTCINQELVIATINSMHTFILWIK